MPGVDSRLKRLARLYEPHVSPSSLSFWCFVRPLVPGPSLVPRPWSCLRTERLTTGRTMISGRKRRTQDETHQNQGKHPGRTTRYGARGPSRFCQFRTNTNGNRAAPWTGIASRNRRPSVTSVIPLPTDAKTSAAWRQKPRFPQTRPRRPSFPSGPRWQYAYKRVAEGLLADGVYRDRVRRGARREASRRFQVARETAGRESGRGEQPQAHGA